MASSTSDAGVGTSRLVPVAVGPAELLSLPLLYLVLPPFFAGCLLSRCNDRRGVALGAMALILLTVWGGIVNHYADWQSDEINHKRPWLHRHRSRSSLVSYQGYVLTAYVTLVVAGFHDKPATLLMFLAGILGALQYSALSKIENRLWLSDLYLALAYGVYPILVGMLIGGGVATLFSNKFVLWSSFLLFLDLGVAPFKDYGDQEGDRKTNKRTLPNIYGLHQTVKFQATMIVVATTIAVFQAQSHPQSQMTWALVFTCLGLLMLLWLRYRIHTHHEIFLHFAALLSCSGRLALLITLM